MSWILPESRLSPAGRPEGNETPVPGIEVHMRNREFPLIPEREVSDPALVLGRRRFLRAGAAALAATLPACFAGPEEAGAASSPVAGSRRFAARCRARETSHGTGDSS